MTIEPLSTEQSLTPDALLAELGECDASGVLEISHPGDEVSYVWVREGRIYAMQVPGYRPALGIRLLSGGMISPEQLSAAAAEQRERFPSDLIGQVLVGMGLVSAEVIDAFVRDQVLDQVADLLDLPILGSVFHPGRRVQHDVITPTDVGELVEVARERRAARADVLALVGGPDAVPVLVPPGQGSVQTPLGPYDWALLCRVDGRRDITELARVCGYTVHEAAQMVADLTMTGLLVLPEAVEPPDEPLAPVVTLHPDAPTTPPEPQWHFDGTVAGEPEPVGDLLAELSAFAHEEPGAPPASSIAPPVGIDGTEPMPVGIDATEPPPVGPAAETALDGPRTDVTAAAIEDPTADLDHAPLDEASRPDAAPAAWTAPETPIAAADPAPIETAEAVPEPALIGAAEQAPLAADATRAETAPVHASAPHGVAPDTPDLASPGASQMFPVGAPVAPVQDQSGYSDTSVFMRELSSLSDDADEAESVVTRQVVPFTEPRRKRRFWGR